MKYRQSFAKYMLVKYNVLLVPYLLKINLKLSNVIFLKDHNIKNSLNTVKPKTNDTFD